MKQRIKYSLFVIFALLMITGCFNKIPGIRKSPEVLLCDKVDSIITQYKNKQISFDDLANQFSSIYNDSCDSENDICIDIKNIISKKNQTYEILDCSRYKNTNKEMYELCESKNALTRESLTKQTQFEEAAVSSLEMSCAYARD